MPNTRFDVAGVGNAIVDVLAYAADRFLDLHGLTKGSMTLIEKDDAEKLYGHMGPAVECSGGSVANAIAAIASMGGKCAFMGKVGDDQLGGVFRHDIRSLGVEFNSPPVKGGPTTARCLILVTPDGQRTMQTYLGACNELSPTDVDEQIILDSKLTFLEAYLWDEEGGREAAKLAARIANNGGRLVAFNLADPGCVDDHRDDFMDFINNQVDILFANEREIMTLYGVSNFDDALQRVSGHCEIAALTRSSKGSIVISGTEVHVIDAEKVEQVVDTTGAGDNYAAGFLYGYTHGFGLGDCARMGNLAASHVIKHVGARPDVSLKDIITSRFEGRQVRK